jgi:hypothetical protein
LQEKEVLNLRIKSLEGQVADVRQVCGLELLACEALSY